MTSSQRIIVNTAAQYTRTIINVCLSLYSTRLILASLGQMDYGVYSLVAGVVALLSFITNAMVTTTQRYLSFNHGQGNKEQIYQVFGNSMLLHLLIGTLFFVILAALCPYFTFHFLNIESARQSAACWVYMAASVMLLLSFITAPYRALFIARENIVYISLVDIVDGILKLIIAIALTYVIQWDKLIVYALLMMGISFFNLFAFMIYAHLHFEECHIPHLKEWDKNYIHTLSGFAGWTIYSTGCIIARTQGLAIILNQFMGAIANAAYGVAQQVTGAMQFLASAVSNAMSPQIVKAEGQNDRNRMLSLSEQCSKYAYLLLAIISLPVIAEMPAILTFWLGDVPENAILFCRGVLLASVVDQLTIGLGTANQAIGQIRTYSIVINTIKVFTLPASLLCLYAGLHVTSVMVCYVGFELLCALCRLPFLKATAGLSISHFCQHVFIPVIMPTLLMILTCYGMTRIQIPYRFVLTIMAAGIVGLTSIFAFSLQKSERQHVINYIRQITK